jgi:hypothetical protein
VLTIFGITSMSERRQNGRREGLDSIKFRLDGTLPLRARSANPCGG